MSLTDKLEEYRALGWAPTVKWSDKRNAWEAAVGVNLDPATHWGTSIIAWGADPLVALESAASQLATEIASYRARHADD